MKKKILVTRRTKIILITPLLIALVCAIMMIDVVHFEGGHVSYLVLASYPTLSFECMGGVEEQWERSHPGKAPPWSYRGYYLFLEEVTGP